MKTISAIKQLNIIIIILNEPKPNPLFEMPLLKGMKNIKNIIAVNATAAWEIKLFPFLRPFVNNNNITPTTGAINAVGAKFTEIALQSPKAIKTTAFIKLALAGCITYWFWLSNTYNDKHNRWNILSYKTKDLLLLNYNSQS